MIDRKWLTSFMNAQKAVLAKAHLPSQLKAAPEHAVDLVRGSGSRSAIRQLGGFLRDYSIVDPQRRTLARFRVAERVPTLKGRTKRYVLADDAYMKKHGLGKVEVPAPPVSEPVSYIHGHGEPLASPFGRYFNSITIPQLIGKQNTARVARQFAAMQRGTSQKRFSRTGNYILNRTLAGSFAIPSRKRLVLGEHGIKQATKRLM